MDRRMRKAYETYCEAGQYDKAFSCLYHLYQDDYREAYSRVKEFRNMISQKLEWRDVLKKAYLMSAKEYFDDFMVYIEWDRPLKQKYWLPRRAKLKQACDVLQAMEDGEIDELFLSMPPRVGKTTLMVFFVLWVILRDSERSNLYCSYTDSVVQVFYNGLMEILNDPVTYLWQDVFPNSTVASTNAMDKLLNIDRKKRYASFTGRSLYGTLNGACDCNGYEIADDLISGIEEAMNKDRLNNAWLKVDNNYLPRAKQGAKRLWIGTRWSMTDPIARRIDLLENDDRFASVRYRIINMPALNENDESNFEYHCNVGFDTDYYQQRRASFERNNDMASWLAQYMGTPIERDGSVFAPDDFRYYNGVLPTDCDPDRVFGIFDPAWGGGDFVAGPICYQYGNDIYIADVVYNNGEKRVTQPDIANKLIKHNASASCIEGTKMTSGYAEGVDAILKSKGYNINMQTSTKHFTGNGKAQRIFDKAPDIRERMIFLESGKRSKEYEMFMQNVFSFTITGGNKQHDDAPDSLAMAITYMIPNNGVMEIRKRSF